MLFFGQPHPKGMLEIQGAFWSHLGEMKGRYAFFLGPPPLLIRNNERPLKNTNTTKYSLFKAKQTTLQNDSPLTIIFTATLPSESTHTWHFPFFKAPEGHGIVCTPLEHGME